MAHFTCINADDQGIEAMLKQLQAKGIDNVLALRGDLPEGTSLEHAEYQHASDLAKKIKSFGDFCVGGACYPEGHPESAGLNDDIEKLKIKVDSGVEFLVTQMFFDNDVMYNYMYRLLAHGITVPVVPGVMPVTNAKQIQHICKLSGTKLPLRFLQAERHQAAVAFPGHCRKVRGRSGGHEAGGDQLRHGSGAGPAG